MKRSLLLAALLAASPAFADNTDVDLLPNGYVSFVIRITQLERSERRAPAMGEADVRFANPPATNPQAQVAAEQRNDGASAAFPPAPRFSHVDPNSAQPIAAPGPR